MTMMAPTWRETLASFKERPVVTMLFLGYAAGVPLIIVLSTTGYWLREMGVSRTSIGFLVWASLPWALKVFWAPLVDRIPLPFLTAWLGKRRSYMLLSQIGIVCGMIGIVLLDPQASTAFKAGVLPVFGGMSNAEVTPPGTNVVLAMAILLFVIAVSSATQDIVVDAFRIESAPDDRQGVMAAAYQYGYRIAMFAAGAGALYIAYAADWVTAYFVIAISMGIGMATVLAIREPPHEAVEREHDHETALSERVAALGHLHGRRKHMAAWFSSAVISPLAEFFRRNGWMAIVVLALIGSFRLSDLTLGAMANPFYVDIGFSKLDIANIGKTFGLFVTLVGIALGGVTVVRFGIMPMLLLTAVLLTITNLLFAAMAMVGPELWMLAITISADNLAGGMSGTVFIAYLSALTNRAYTATQYALFTSLMSLFGKFVAGFSGVVVDATDYVTFFIYASILGVPSILLIIFIRIRGREGMPAFERLPTGAMVP